MKTIIRATEPDFLVINQPLPEADRAKLSAIIAQAKRANSEAKKPIAHRPKIAAK